MQNSGRSQSPAVGRHGVPAGFSYAGDPGEGKVARHREKTNRFTSRERQSDTGEPGGEVQENPCTEQCLHPQGNPRAPISQDQEAGSQVPPTSPRSLPYPHQAVCAASAVGALGPRTQRAVVGKAAGAGALLEPGRRGESRSGCSAQTSGEGAGGSQFGPPGLVLRTPPGRRRNRTPRPFLQSRFRSAPAAPGARSPARWRGKRPLPFGRRRAAGGGCRR